MSTLIITRNYLDGNDLTEAQLDSANDSIETWANGNVGTDNLVALAVTTAKIDSTAVTLSKLASEVTLRLFAPGMILSYGAASAPTGWLLCDGSAVSRSTYSGLFSIIGESHGEGDGVTTFKVPDYRGRFLRGVDSGQGRDPDAASRTAMNTGGNSGDAVGSIQADGTAKNALALNDPTHAHSVTVTTAGGLSATAVQGSGSSSGNATAAATSTGITLGNGDNETRPVNAAVWFIIKT